MNKFKIAYSEIKDTVKAVKSLKEQLADVDAGLVLFFVASSYPVETVSKEMSNVFDGVHTVGCTTCGEMITGKMLQNSIVAMAWHKDSLEDLKIEILEDIKTDTDVVKKAFKSFDASLKKPIKDLDPSQYVGLIIIDGLSGCEENLNDQIGNLTNVPFVGGSAGDYLKFQFTYIFVDGKTYTNAAVLLLMQPTKGYEILKTQSFTITDKKLIPTKVNEKRRMVIEFNGKPAIEALSEITGISVEELSKNISEHPVGLVFDEKNFFVRSPMKVEGTSIIFYCSVKEGLELTLLHAGDIVTDTKADLQKFGNMEAIVDFNCCLRHLELSRKNQLQDYSEIFGKTPSIGFATYGESYIGHINQTSTMLLLK